MLSSGKHNENLESLIEKAQDGNESAFGQIYDLYFNKIYRFIFFRVNHKQSAEDLTAETFIRVWGKLSGISDTRAFQGWLYQIARNLVIDYYRSRKEIVDITTLENVLEYEDNILDKTNLGFLQQEFLQALKKLSDDQQAVIKLKFLEDLGNSEIAQILGKTEGTIRVIQHRATAVLKGLLEKHEQ